MRQIRKIGMWLWKNKIKALLLFIFIGGGSYYWQQEREAAESIANNKLKKAVVQKGDIEVLVSGSGQVQPASQVDLRPQVAGDGIDIFSIEVENDQEVKEGDIIATLDIEEASESIRDVSLELRSSKIRKKQVEDESHRKTIKDTRIRQLQEIEVQQRLNKLADARKNLQDYYIKAPFDGIVTGLDFESGDSVARDEILASVITKEMVAKISLNEIDAVKVIKGAEAKLTFSTLEGVEVSGIVAKVDTIGEVSQGVVSYDAEISFDASKALGLKPGMSVEVEITIAAKQDVLIVPISAVQSNPRRESFVLVISEEFSLENTLSDISWLDRDNESGDQKDKGTRMPKGVKRVLVEIGISNDVMTEISGEISVGEVVLTQTLQSLMNNINLKKGVTEDSNKSLIPMGRGIGSGGRR